MEPHDTNDTHDAPTERERLAQELLELHFGCHPDPEPLRERLANDPSLAALQVEVLATADLLAAAAAPATSRLELSQSPTPPRRPWLTQIGRSAPRRIAAVATAASLIVAGFGAYWLRCVAVERAVRADALHVTVSAPRTIASGAPWTFTVEGADLDGRPQRGEVRWALVGADGQALDAGTTPVDGRESFTVSSRLAAVQRLDVAWHGDGEPVRCSLPLTTSRPAPMVHVTTDKPVYRPGEVVRVRGVVLDRATLQPTTLGADVGMRILDPKGAPVFTQPAVAVRAEKVVAVPSVATSEWNVPNDVVGGAFTVELYSTIDAFPPERLPIVVRGYESLRLRQTLALGRKTYRPGETASAEVKVTRIVGGAPAGASVRASLVVDGAEAWSTASTLDDSGFARFRFEIPTVVARGAARFVTTVTDGGVVETAVEPFVVPTGDLRARTFAEGGELVAGVVNRVYVELVDTLDRPIDGQGTVVDARGQAVAAFVTEHQGRGRFEFVPERGIDYALRVVGSETSHPLAKVRDAGLVLQSLDDGVAAGAPVRVQVRGRGEGPFVVGAFCRGVLVGQSVLRPTSADLIDATVSIDVPAAAAGVLRVTVFDRRFQPIAERLVRRLASQRVAVDLSPRHAERTPGASQTLDVTTRDEHGAPIAAIVGVMVTDDADLAKGDEPRVSLADHAALFADVERLEDLGDWFVGGADAERNVDLLLGTRGWRRFVWRGDDAARTAIAGAGTWAAGQLGREGVAESPQVFGNRQQAEAATFAVARDRRQAWRGLQWAGVAALAALGAWLLGEVVARRPARTRLPWLVASVGAAAAIVVFVVPSPLGSRLRDGFLAGGDAGRVEAKWEFDVEVAQAAAVNVVVEEGRNAPVAIDAGVGGIQPVAALLLRDDFRDDAAREIRKQTRLAIAREYAHTHVRSEHRSDFTSTIYWNPLLLTGADGRASVTFDTSDAVTTWRARADAHGNGRVGSGSTTFETRLPFEVACKLPVEVSAGDRLLLPVALTLRNGDGDHATVDVEVGGGLRVVGDARAVVPLRDGRGRHRIAVDVGDAVGEARIVVRAMAGGQRDQVARTLSIVPRGFPTQRSFGGTVASDAPANLRVTVPADAAPGSGRVTVRVFPSPLAGMSGGMAGMLREPHGCFEQASSTNYPNVMVLSFLEASGDDVPVLAARAGELLPRGYRRLVGYECKQRGYEWFGGDPGHEALTAYGLLQFHDMAKVFDVDAGMMARTKTWLLERRDGSGGYRANDRALDSFGRAPKAVSDAYVTYALLHSGVDAAAVRVELDACARRADASDDAYELALVALALDIGRHPAAGVARTRLAAMQRDDGSLRGATTTITSSGGDDLSVETTAFAVLAWLRDPAFVGRVRSGVAYLQGKRRGNGTFGATQATICALRALTAYATQFRSSGEGGVVTVSVGGRMLASQPFAAQQSEPVTFELWSMLPAGVHELTIARSGGGAALPFTCEVGYHSEQPASDADVKVALTTALVEAEVDEGRTFAIEVAVRNRTAEGLPMTLAVVGLPAGCDVPTNVLDDRRRAGDFDLWELRGRELVLYWRSLAPHADRRVTLDLVASIPGVTVGPASRAYLYYTPDAKHWAPPLRLSVK